MIENLIIKMKKVEFRKKLDLSPKRVQKKLLDAMNLALQAFFVVLDAFFH